MEQLEFKQINYLDYNEINQIISCEKEAFSQHGLTIMSIIPFLQFQYVFIGKINDKVICEAQLIEDINNKNSIFLFGFAVRKNYQNRGIGKRFLNFIEQSLDKKFSYLKLYVDPSGAIEFYRKLGYKEIKMYDNLYLEFGSRVLLEKKIKGN